MLVPRDADMSKNCVLGGATDDSVTHVDPACVAENTDSWKNDQWQPAKLLERALSMA